MQEVCDLPEFSTPTENVRSSAASDTDKHVRILNGNFFRISLKNKEGSKRKYKYSYVFILIFSRLLKTDFNSKLFIQSSRI